MTKPKTQFEYCYRVMACSELSNREKTLGVLLGLRARSDSLTVYRAAETLSVDLAAARQNVYAWRRALLAKGWLSETPKTRGRGTAVYALKIPACRCPGCSDWTAREAG